MRRGLALVVAALVAAVFALAGAPARADDAAPATLVRARLDPPGPVDAGTSVRLVVDVLVTTFFTAAPEFPTLDLPGAIVALSDAQADKLTEHHDGVPWFGLSRAYLVTPTVPGTLAIPPLKVTLHPGPGVIAVLVVTPALRLTVAAPFRPPGAEDAVGAARLTVTQHLDRSTTGLHVGDAVKRTIALAADGVRAMQLPPTTFGAIDGLAVYPDQPDVEDAVDAQGAFTGGRRVDAATYVVQRAGAYALPAVAITWWDTAAQRLRTTTVPAVTFAAAAASVDTAPAIALPEEAAPRVRPRTIVGVAAAVAVLVVAWLVAPAVRRGVRRRREARAERRRRHAASEPVAFEHVRAAARDDDAAATFAAASTWLARFRPGGAPTLARLCDVTGDDALRAATDTLARQLFGAPAPSWSGQAILADLERVRGRLAVRAAPPAPPLPPLNPV